jgi:hypothetical protein
LVAAILSSAPLRLRITAHDEQFSDTRTDLVGLPCAEGIVAQVNAFNGPGWRDLANPNLHWLYETKVTCSVTKVTTCGGRNPFRVRAGTRESKGGASHAEIFGVEGNSRQNARAENRSPCGKTKRSLKNRARSKDSWKPRRSYSSDIRTDLLPVLLGRGY